MRRFTFLFLMSSFLFTACSSAPPDFKPSKPLEEAASFHEAIDLCNAYEIVGKTDSDGRAKSTKLVMLLPWEHCFESIFLKFPEAWSDEDFVMFFRALKARADNRNQSPENSSVDWLEMNQAVHQVVKHLHNKSLEYSKEELNVIHNQLPGFYLYLVETGRSKQGKPYLVHDVEIQNWVNEVKKAAKEAAYSNILTKKEQEYCSRYRSFQDLVLKLEKLSRYKESLEEKNQEIQKIKTRISTLKKRAIGQKAQLDQQQARITALKYWFNNGYCLYK